MLYQAYMWKVFHQQWGWSSSKVFGTKSSAVNLVSRFTKLNQKTKTEICRTCFRRTVHENEFLHQWIPCNNWECVNNGDGGPFKQSFLQGIILTSECSIWLNYLQQTQSWCSSKRLFLWKILWNLQENSMEFFLLYR